MEEEPKTAQETLAPTENRRIVRYRDWTIDEVIASVDPNYALGSMTVVYEFTGGSVGVTDQDRDPYREGAIRLR